jgi:hypothetical protein
LCEHSSSATASGKPDAVPAADLIVSHQYFIEFMPPKIIEKHSEADVCVKSIVVRILKFLKETDLNGLNEILILDASEEKNCFGLYNRNEQRIELYVGDIIGWLPWILKKTYLLPYLFIGTALGHELDHHLNRLNDLSDKEVSAEANAFKYVYPSLGVFKPIAALILLLMRKRPFRKIFENP